MRQKSLSKKFNTLNDIVNSCVYNNVNDSSFKKQWAPPDSKTWGNRSGRNDVEYAILWSERTKRSRSHSYHSTPRRCLLGCPQESKHAGVLLQRTQGPVLTDRRLAGNPGCNGGCPELRRPRIVATICNCDATKSWAPPACLLDIPLPLS
jgi:hypothetical protein